MANNGVKSSIIMNGGKIMQLDVPAFNIKFRDSYSFCPQSLASWPKTFGLTDVAKGTFPHRFNRSENWNKVVPFPTTTDFGVESMRPAQKSDLIEWYEKEKTAKNSVYDFNTEMASYCRMDVEVLRRCCELFRKLFMDISDGICPFVCSTTIAGLCSYYWRSRILKPDVIGLLPLNSTNRFQSKVAMMWLDWEALEGRESSSK